MRIEDAEEHLMFEGSGRIRIMGDNRQRGERRDPSILPNSLGQGLSDLDPSLVTY